MLHLHLVVRLPGLQNRSRAVCYLELNEVQQDRSRNQNLNMIFLLDMCDGAVSGSRVARTVVIDVVGVAQSSALSLGHSAPFVACSWTWHLVA